MLDVLRSGSSSVDWVSFRVRVRQVVCNRELGRPSSPVGQQAVAQLAVSVGEVPLVAVQAYLPFEYSSCVRTSVGHSAVRSTARLVGPERAATFHVLAL